MGKLARLKALATRPGRWPGLSAAGTSQRHLIGSARLSALAVQSARNHLVASGEWNEDSAHQALGVRSVEPRRPG
jgi:hypothetical protein